MDFLKINGNVQFSVRYNLLDTIRGITIISMILYHTLWDFVYIGNFNFNWYNSDLSYIWQQSICWSFIFISGFCWQLDKKRLKRGIFIFFLGFLITAITKIFIPDHQIIFGILTLLGSCIIFTIPLNKILKNVSERCGLFISIALFFLFRNINNGYLGFEKFNIIKLPMCLYNGYFMTYIGFTDKKFFSEDYFSVLPWLFLFVAGYFTYKILYKNEKLYLLKNGIRGLEHLGKYSLIIYILHQPIIYFIFFIIN